MKKAFKIILSVLAVIVIFFAVSVWYSANVLTVNTYDIETDKIDGSISFVLISDLHCKEFGRDNSNLVDVISQQDPDFIAVCGDMVTDTVEDDSVIITLIKKLQKVAPVYYALGNHEYSYYDYDQLISDIKSTGTTLLDNDMKTLNIRGNNITVGGLTDFAYYPSDAPDYDTEERHFLDKFIKQENENYSILLTHCPEYYIWKPEAMNVDLLLCGHTHGGLIRLPFVGGLYAPNQGWFPQYDMGYYDTGITEMIITSGLSNDVAVPRLFNPPEVCVINVN